MEVCKEIIKEIKKQKIKNQKELNRLKIKIAKKYHLSKIPNNIEISNKASSKDRKKLSNLLTIKPVRTLSGVAPIALMCPPHKCPHGKCFYCPGGVDSCFGDVPQSYTGKEPATRRAIRNNYDPYLQVMNRLEQYVVMNKVPEKAEIIIMGGTFLSLPKKEQNKFVMYIFKALNDFGKFYNNYEKFNKFFEQNVSKDDKERETRIKNRLLKLKKSSTLEKEQKRNEKAKIRCISLVIETRPDYCGKKEIEQMLKLGCTKVELGVQTIYDDVLKKIERGHKVEDTIKATKLLREVGLKITYHIMPGLPGVTEKMDLEAFKTYFEDENFKPDMLKIYPCMVMKGTKLYDLYKNKKFKPLTTKKAISLIKKFKKYVPEYVRINRVQRDIPSNQVIAGVDKTNLRQLMNAECNCIRCREIGRRKPNGKLSFKTITYDANGKEYFISANKGDALIGFCRLRKGKKNFIRELHVYGEATSLKEKGNIQHKGVGKKLLKMAENIADGKLYVTSGIGVREYYRKQGYRKKGYYMVK